MRLILDAHVLLWAIYLPSMLPGRIKALLADRDNELYVSHATLWELLNKVGRGRLLLAGNSVDATLAEIVALGVTSFRSIRLSFLRRPLFLITTATPSIACLSPRQLLAI